MFLKLNKFDYEKPVNELVIDREKWSRGAGVMNTYLLDSYGKYCVLGFLGSACGIPDSALRFRSNPDTAAPYKWPKYINKRTSWCSAGSEFFVEAAKINDSQSLSDKIREHILKELFKSVSVNLTFKN